MKDRLISNTMAKALGWIGIVLFFVVGAIDLLRPWEMQNPPHPVAMLALAVGSIAILRTTR